MYLLPIEICLALVIVIPAGVCFAKWKWEWTSMSAVFICAVLSWVYFFLAMNFDPPDNGFSNLFYLVTGWFWLLPVLFVLLPVFAFAKRKVGRQRAAEVGSTGFIWCARLTIAILIWNVIGRPSENRAVQEARKELRRNGHEPVGRELPSYRQGHWVIRYPDSTFKEIGLTRNGRMSWIGEY